MSHPRRRLFAGDSRLFGAEHALRRKPRPASNIEQKFANSLTAVPPENLGVSGAFYVPVYSSVSMSQGKLRADFSVTLSVHNASETRPLVLKRIAYFDTSGKMVESYLKAPIALKPFSTIEVFIPTTDVRGGTGANFVVDWAATGEIAEPAVEALMVGGVGECALCIHQPGAAQLSSSARTSRPETPDNRRSQQK